MRFTNVHIVCSAPNFQAIFLNHGAEEMIGGGGNSLESHSLKPRDYFEKQGHTLVEKIKTALTTEVTHTTQVPTEAGFEQFNDSGMIINFMRNGEAHRAVFGVKLEGDAYNLKVRIENSKGKVVRDKEMQGIENIHRLQMIFALAIPEAFMPGRDS
ncbi:hypothetical protein COV82_04720 [Candidatus Peregrinibacteria bacterium CG11_big_fil_rev_8_21_14_0_20_46_8]|nr:MAG: hypothetical protein COV82_04720 [Candidatus Peregrinibacteria bacterium CG11_big_fil_rev_8_21_14_0_20_46_8]